MEYGGRGGRRVLEVQQGATSTAARVNSKKRNPGVAGLYGCLYVWSSG